MPIKQTLQDLKNIIQFQQELITYHGELSTLMNLICQKCMELTKANGSVIEVEDENYMVYQAAAGALKDYVGLRLKIESSLSGLSAKTREIKISNEL